MVMIPREVSLKVLREQDFSGLPQPWGRNGEGPAASIDWAYTMSVLAAKWTGSAASVVSVRSTGAGTPEVSPRRTMAPPM